MVTAFGLSGLLVMCESRAILTHKIGMKVFYF